MKKNFFIILLLLTQLNLTEIIENKSYTDKKTIIRYSFFANPICAASFKKAVEKFVELNPDIAVKFEPLPWVQYWTKLKTQVAGRIAPDVFMLSSGGSGSEIWFQRDSCFNLNHFIKKYNINLNNYFEIVKSGIIRDNKVLGLPFGIPTFILMYDKNLFDQANLPYLSPNQPLTWQEFIEICRKLTIKKNGKIVQYGFSALLSPEILFIRQAGGTIFTPSINPTKIHFDTKEALEGIKFFNDIVNTYEITPKDYFQQSELGFGKPHFALLSGKIGICLTGYHVLQNFIDAKIRFGLAPLFQGKLRISMTGCNFLTVYTYTKYPESAFRLIKFLTEKEGQIILTKGGGVDVPALKEVAYSDVFLKGEGKPEHMEVFLDEIEHSVPGYIFIKDEEFSEILVKNNSLLRAGTITSYEMVKRIQEEGTNLLNRIQPTKISFLVKTIIPLILLLLCILLITYFIIKAIKKNIFLVAKKEENVNGYFFLSIWIIGFLLFSLCPILTALYLSFNSWDLFSSPKWFGVENYKIMFCEPLFWQSLKVSFIYTFFSVPLLVISGLFVAFLLNQNIKFKGIFRTILYIPGLLAGVAVTYLWMWLYNKDVGIINFIIQKIFRIEGPNWLYDEKFALLAIILMNFIGIGGNMLIFLAALQEVPFQLYEAADIDGADQKSKFFHITLPMISPVILFVTIMNTIGALQSFMQPYIMTKGGPNNSTYMFLLYLYNKAFRDMEMGYACGLAMVITIIIFCLTFLYLKTSKKWVYYEMKNIEEKQ